MKNCDSTHQNKEGAECPSCHGTGRIGTANWLIKGMTKRQIAKEKAEARDEYVRELQIATAEDVIKKAKVLFCPGEIYTCEEIRAVLDFLESEIKKKNKKE